MQSVQNVDQKNCSLGELEAFCDEILNLDSKIRFAGIIAFSAILLRDLKKTQILNDSQLFANRDWEKQNVS